MFSDSNYSKESKLRLISQNLYMSIQDEKEEEEDISIAQYKNIP
jgi:hypothetical protein